MVMAGLQGVVMIAFPYMAGTPLLLYLGAALIGFNFGGNFALFPSATAAQVIAGQHKVNHVVEGTNFPKVPDEMIHNIIYENWKRFLPEYA